MEALFASGRIIDAILILVALEALALLAWRFRQGHGPSPVALVANLLSGAALMLALRTALTGGHWSVLAACLAISLVCHVTDLALRLREPQQSRDGHRPTRWLRTRNS